MIVLLNRRAGGGTAPEKWRRLQSHLTMTNEFVEVLHPDDRTDMTDVVLKSQKRGDTHIVAAGGDGTIHNVLNAMMLVPEAMRSTLVLGAIGLGSSNDFHKPISPLRCVDGIPCALHFRNACRRDVGVATMRTSMGVVTEYFLLNASVGVCAAGNEIFNQPDLVLSWLKAHYAGGAILVAAILAIARYHNMRCAIEWRTGERLNIALTNLGIMKSPHFSGSLHYDGAANYHNGQFQVFGATDLAFLHRLQFLWYLSRGKFLKSRSGWMRTTDSLKLESLTEFSVELDGEIFLADQVQFSVLRNALMVCS